MNTYTVQQPQIAMTGVSVRTTNAEELGTNGQLSKLWDTYFQSHLASQAGINNPHLIYALYTDYESDASGAYTVVIGHELGEDALDHNDNHTVIPESKYLVFTTNKGPVYEVVAQCWGEIWSYFKDSEEVRTFTGDFELYDAGKFDPTQAVVKIYIAIQ
ncbi:GyrI-like domain-containing protein [Paenibacillus antarcticus]|uniref:Transcriptional regulator n=1 Tax=Paenibacillus antarcticus TaxID=253703 RepID=A0A168Q228_9BACL|nr:GyrI-like domain-containing protein [Paenibacillus antarcticus]OAB47304.1 transcriptional regulator [Paenibacillus antarcticus]